MTDHYQLLARLLERAEAGELPKKKADMLKHLQGRMAAGSALTEMQAELLEDLAAEHGLA